MAKLPDSVHYKILAMRAAEPTLSARAIARKLGLHHKSVCRALREAEVSTELKEKHELSRDTWTISIPKTRICTEEELIQHCRIDLSKWVIERIVFNKWECAAKGEGGLVVEPLFQVKAFCKRRIGLDARFELEELKRIAKQAAPVVPAIIKQLTRGNMLELAVPDLHIGKLAWAKETGYGNYDTKIAVRVFEEALETLIARSSNYEYEEIILLIGNDLLNSDDVEGRTTSGTYVSNDGRYHKSFAAARDMKIRAIERLRQIAPVRGIVCPGNHDHLSAFHLGDSLECYFHNYADVKIDNSPNPRKYCQFGTNMILFTHGHTGKLKDYPLLMATEQPTMFGSCKFREAHTGHRHHEHVDEQHGVKVRVLGALSDPDTWLSTNHFVGALRTAEAYIWNREEGLISKVFHTRTD